jgi:gluconolactonase
VYIADTDEVFFASNAGGPLSMSDINHNNGIYKLNLADAERMLSSGGNQAVNVPINQVKSLSIPSLDQA